MVGATRGTKDIAGGPAAEMLLRGDPRCWYFYRYPSSHVLYCGFVLFVEMRPIRGRPYVVSGDAVRGLLDNPAGSVSALRPALRRCARNWGVCAVAPMRVSLARGVRYSGRPTEIGCPDPRAVVVLPGGPAHQHWAWLIRLRGALRRSVARVLAAARVGLCPGALFGLSAVAQVRGCGICGCVWGSRGGARVIAVSVFFRGTTVSVPGAPMCVTMGHGVLFRGTMGPPPVCAWVRGCT